MQNNSANGYKIMTDARGLVLAALISAPVVFGLHALAVWLLYGLPTLVLGCLGEMLGFLIRLLPSSGQFFRALPYILGSVLLLALCCLWGTMLSLLVGPSKQPNSVEDKDREQGTLLQKIAFFTPAGIVIFVLIKHWISNP